jgi:hypothetical protein
METTWTHRMRAAGLRVTHLRPAVLELLAGSPHADAIVPSAGADHPTLSPQAVHGVREAPVGTGPAWRIEPAGAPALHGLRVGDEAEVVLRGRCPDSRTAHHDHAGTTSSSNREGVPA